MSHITALFPGTFDPLTRGHIDLVRRSLRIFDTVVVGVLVNASKSCLFSVSERERLISEEFADCSGRVQVRNFQGLLVEFARQVGAQVVIRGLRAISDYDYEAQMALMNKHLYEELETFFMIAREENSYVSSTLVRQIAALGGDVEKLVTPKVAQALRKKLNPGTKSEN
jgi:pantetheine-phosphate adenylyltransferase